MFLGTLLRSCSNAKAARGYRTKLICRAVEGACVEILEDRRLLSTYTVPAGSHTAVFLTKHAFTQGYVDVRLDSDTGAVVTTLTDSSDTISASTYSNFTFVDTIPAYYKPSGGINFTGGTGCKLKIDATGNALDKLITTTPTVSSNGSITTYDATDSAAGTDLYNSTVTQLVIITNNTVATDSSGGTEVDVGEGDGTSALDTASLSSDVPASWVTSLDIQTGATLAATYDTVNLGPTRDPDYYGGEAVTTPTTVETGAGYGAVNLHTDGDDVTTATVDYGTADLGRNNELNVFSGGVGHLASGTVVDNVNVAGGTLIVDHAATIGDLEVTSGGNAVIEADSTSISTCGIDSSSSLSVQQPSDIGDLNLHGDAEFTGTSASSTVDDIAFFGGTLELDYGADVVATTLDWGEGHTGDVEASDTSTFDIDTANVSGTVTFDLSSVADVEVTTFNVTDGGIVNVDGGSELTVGVSLNLDGTLILGAGSETDVGNLNVDDLGTVNAADTASLAIAYGDVSGELDFNLTSVADVTSDFFYVHDDGVLNVNNGGVLAITAIDAGSGTVNVSSGADLTINYGSTMGVLNVSGTGASVLFEGSGTDIEPSLNVTDGGLVTLLPRADSPSSSTARVLLVGDLYMGSTTSPSGTLDLTDNDLIIVYTGALNDIRDLITSGYDGGAWDGRGITSSAGASDPDGATALGYSEASTLSLSSFDGWDVGGTQVVVKYTYYGDANLDGKVNAIDFNILATNNPSSSGKSWTDADFNYDGAVDGSDVSLKTIGSAAYYIRGQL